MLPISRPDRATDMAGLTCIGRIYKNERDSSLKSLVCQKLSELVEGPTVNPSPLVLSGLLVNILSDVRKVFQSYLSRDLLRPGHYGFADFVVYLSLIACFFARQSLLKLSTPSSRAPCTFHGFLLENSTHRCIMVLDQLNGLSAKILAI